jgi:hypothetical protein
MDIRWIEGKMISGLDDAEMTLFTHSLATAQRQDVIDQWAGLPMGLVIDGSCVGMLLIHCKQ